MPEFLVYVEQSSGSVDEASVEAMVEGRALANKHGATLAALVLGDGVNGTPSLLTELSNWGADKIYTAFDERLARYSLDNYAVALNAALKGQAPGLFMAAATPKAHELCAVVAARLGTSLTPDCVAIDQAADGTLQPVRPVFGGQMHAKIATTATRPPVVTLRPRGGQPGKPKTRQAAAVVAVTLPAVWPEARLETIGYLKADPTKVDISEAEVVIGGGRGAETAAGFDMVRELALAMGGAVAGSRVAVDEGWLTIERQIGQTGKVIAPRLYVACGISGAIHHTAGIKDSKLIIAINKDRHAPIFKMADVAVVGDLQEVLPALTRAVLAARKTAPGADAAGLIGQAMAPSGATASPGGRER